jgi:hypothetical protein
VNTGIMTIRADLLTELLKGFPADATVKGYNDGITIANNDGSGEVVVMNGLTRAANKPVSPAFGVQGLPPSFLTKEVQHRAEEAVDATAESTERLWSR